MEDERQYLPCACSKKIRENAPEEFKLLLNRLSRVEGQVRAIRMKLRNGAHCPDLLLQVAAATAALHSFSKELLSEHLSSCVADDIRNGKNKSLDEFSFIMHKMLR